MIKQGEMTVGYCLTPEMIGDRFTKQLQGALLHKFRAIMMNIDKKAPDVDLAWERELLPTMLQECDGNNVALLSMTQFMVCFGTS